MVEDGEASGEVDGLVDEESSFSWGATMVPFNAVGSLPRSGGDVKGSRFGVEKCAVSPWGGRRVLGPCAGRASAGRPPPGGGGVRWRLGPQFTRSPRFVADGPRRRNVTACAAYHAVRAHSVATAGCRALQRQTVLRGRRR